MLIRISINLTETQYCLAAQAGYRLLNNAVDKDGNPIREMMGGSYTKAEKKVAARMQLEEVVKEYLNSLK